MDAPPDWTKLGEVFVPGAAVRSMDASGRSLADAGMARYHVAVQEIAAARRDVVLLAVILACLLFATLVGAIALEATDRWEEFAPDVVLCVPLIVIPLAFTYFWRRLVVLDNCAFLLLKAVGFG